METVNYEAGYNKGFDDGFEAGRDPVSLGVIAFLVACGAIGGAVLTVLAFLVFG